MKLVDVVSVENTTTITISGTPQSRLGLVQVILKYCFSKSFGLQIYFQVFYSNSSDRNSGSWGTICDDYWSDATGTVMCRELGYVQFIQRFKVKFSSILKIKLKNNRVQKFQFLSFRSTISFQMSSPVSRNKMNIWLDDVICSGYEDWLCDY